jgi:hypothetical protein
MNDGDDNCLQGLVLWIQWDDRSQVSGIGPGTWLDHWGRMLRPLLFHWNIYQKA